MTTPNDHLVRRLVRAGLLVALCDACFAMGTALVRGTSALRVWKGVASVLVGTDALTGGNEMIALGLAMHVLVAFTWSALFLLVVTRSDRVRAILDSHFGPLKIATVLGPTVWLVMSLVVVPLLVHHGPTFNSYYAIMFFGHMVFVGLPMAWAIGSRPA
ncbi:MAG: hypothetical protein ABJE10_20630 [bacterium]